MCCTKYSKSKDCQSHDDCDYRPEQFTAPSSVMYNNRQAYAYQQWLISIYERLTFVRNMPWILRIFGWYFFHYFYYLLLLLLHTASYRILEFLQFCQPCAFSISLKPIIRLPVGEWVSMQTIYFHAYNAHTEYSIHSANTHTHIIHSQMSIAWRYTQEKKPHAMQCNVCTTNETGDTGPSESNI